MSFDLDGPADSAGGSALSLSWLARENPERRVLVSKSPGGRRQVSRHSPPLLAPTWPPELVPSYVVPNRETDAAIQVRSGRPTTQTPSAFRTAYRRIRTSRFRTCWYILGEGGIDMEHYSCAKRSRKSSFVAALVFGGFIVLCVGQTAAPKKSPSTVTSTASPTAQYVSDMSWTTMKNGWGPAERDMSNGELNGGDGRQLSIGGNPYAKGLGVHAPSEVRFNLGGMCSTFSAVTGIADEFRQRGSVVFQVWADGTKLYDSGLFNGTMNKQNVTVDVTDRDELALIVTDAADGNGGDHANWADAKVICTRPAKTTRPRVVRHQSNTDVMKAKVTAFFSKPMDHTTMTRSTFFVRSQHSSKAVATALSYDAATRTATLDPVTSLEAGTTYLVTIKAGAAGVKDLAGNALAADERWSFTTSRGALQPRQPLVLSGQKDVTLRGIYVRNLSGPCMTIQGKSKNIRIEDSELGPCQGGIIVQSSESVIVSNVYIHGDGQSGSGVDITSSQNVSIADNRIENVRTGVYALDSGGVRVERNQFLNMTGPMPRGQFVQFNKVSAAGNRVKCNVGRNLLGHSQPEDAISLHNSRGNPDDPIQVIGNKIHGGGPSLSGGGIMLGDGGGAHQVARDNVLVDPGQYGIAVAGGTDIAATNNRIYARQQSFTNVGLYVWNQDSSTCSSITVHSNEVNWFNNRGLQNPSWNAGNCGSVMGWDRNNWRAAIDAAILSVPIAACPEQRPSEQ